MTQLYIEMLGAAAIANIALLPLARLYADLLIRISKLPATAVRVVLGGLVYLSYAAAIVTPVFVLISIARRDVDGKVPWPRGVAILLCFAFSQILPTWYVFVRRIDELRSAGYFKR